jgi:hypothetical protein
LKREFLCQGVKKVRKEKIMALNINKNGYYSVLLYRDGKKSRFYIARLVALHFIENPNNYKEVDHINRIKSDNRLENLRWADRFMQNQNKSCVENAKHFTVSYCKNIDPPKKWRVEYRIGKKKSRFFLTEKEARDFANTLDRNLLEPVKKSKENK